jgi:hypothetical protein
VLPGEEGKILLGGFKRDYAATLASEDKNGFGDLLFPA